MAVSGDRRRSVSKADCTAVAHQCSTAAEENARRAVEQQAAAIAIERNRLGPADATEWLTLETRGEKLESPHYPGDEILEMARQRVQGVIGR